MRHSSTCRCANTPSCGLRWPDMPNKLLRCAAAVAALLALAAVYASYLQPALLLTLANQVWGCF